MTKNHKLTWLVLALAAALPAMAVAQIVTTPRVQIFRGGSGAWIGVGVLDVTEDNMRALKLKEERGVEVQSVTSDSPAAKAGLKEHDAILEYNGTRVEGVEQFKRLISETPAGRNVKLLISRDSATQTVSVKLEERSSSIHR